MVSSDDWFVLVFFLVVCVVIVGSEGQDSSVCPHAGAPALARARAMGARAFTMDALDAMSSDDDDEEEEGEEGEDVVDVPVERRVVETTTTTTTIDYAALQRHGVRARSLADGARAGGACVGPTTWGRGVANARREAYTTEESTATRRAVGEGLTGTCAEALESARERERARAEAEEARRMERAKSRERHVETKRALRADDRVKREREAEVRANAGETTAPKSRRHKVDLTTRREAEVEEVDEATLIATGGFDFGD